MKSIYPTKKHKPFIKNVFILAALVVCTYSLRAQTTVASYDFNTGLQGWTDGGSDAGSYSSSSWSCSGSRCIYTKDDQTSNNYMTSPVLNLSFYTSIDISFCHKASGVDDNEGFNLQYYDGTSWTIVRTWERDTDWSSNGTSNPHYFSHTLDDTTYTFNSSSRFRFSGTASGDSEYNFIDDVLIEGTSPPGPEIDVQGNSISIANNDLSPAVSDHTDFESVNVSESKSRTFTINNTGTTALTISSITLSNTTDFSIIGTPFSSPIAAGGSTTFQVQFNSNTAGLKSSTVTIANDDLDESSFVFGIQATAEQNFFDSDGDGVLDNMDIDDDNDGIADALEEAACKNSNISVTTNYKFLNESFGTGNRTTINTTYDAVTTYCYEDGTASCSSGGDDLNDGEYTVYYRAADGDGIDDTPIEEVGSWADAYWYTGEDHTTGDTNGRMAMFNAAIDPGIFYTANITGALPNIPITYSFWVLNLDTVDAPGIATRLRPDILVEFRDASNNLLASITTGDIPPSINGDAAGSWHNFSADLTFSVSEFNVYFYNNQLGGLGNDLAIDDIEITQTLCDTDGDSVADVFDLDSDNDGIPDVVESGFATTSNGKAYIDTWVDSNANGMHDAAEGVTPLDSDGDGTPNFLDLDSDNDTIFDVDESGAGNSGDSSFENGDGDIDGDGVGDGEDTDAVREKDFNSDGTSEYFADGILDIYDFLDGSTMSTAFGNQNQGMGHTYHVLDSDGDGLPDYIDTYNNSTSTYDISQTLYPHLDSNNDGVIDDTNDADGDGLLDLFDTNDSAFGSPRDISTKLQLYFDGRNDYIKDESLTSGWSDITLMGWIKLDPSGSGTSRMLFGQGNFNLRLLPGDNIQVVASGSSLISGTTLAGSRWIHIAATYSSTSEELNLYINGALNRSISKSGALNSDTSSFTIGSNTANTNLFFKGYVDEVRLFDKALSDDEVQKLVYQEIEDNGNVRGTEIPRDISSLSWSNLVKYYRLDSFKGDITDNLTTPAVDEGTGAKMYNIKEITYQSAPMPFVSQQGNTSLPLAVNISADGVRGEDVVDYDWSIVRIEHDDITYSDTQKHLGLYINKEDASSNAIEYHVTNDSELNVSWYLKLDGFIDLEGESQLIQGDDGLLDPTSKGKIERDQQGTADTYTYNVWSSPVSIINETSNNTDYTIPQVIMDGSDASNPQTISFIGGYDGTNTSPIGIAFHWLWKFSNSTSGDYSSWQHVRRTGLMSPGEGFTMKGPGTGDILDEQNYVFSGKPNNGDITLNINSGNSYLVGNPYASAIDADEFINDNPNLSGTLSFWEHWGGGSHILSEYQGGYALYNLSGGVSAPAPHPDVAQVGVGTKTPGRYIPVGQGFFVNGTSNGTITFENDQRIFAKESGGNSIFMRGTNVTNSQPIDSIVDERMKFRLGFKSSNTLQLSRQILLTIDENTTPDVDWAYDGILSNAQTDDMFWMINDEKYIIQASNEANTTTIFPLGIETSIDGMNTIRIDSLQHVPEDLNIYIHDIDLSLYHDLRTEDYEVLLSAGDHLSRFELVFDNPETLSNDELTVEDLKMYYSSNRGKIVVLNPKLIELEQMQLYNINGQVVYTNTDLWQETYNEYQLQDLSTGVYIIQLKTITGIHSKKIIIE